MHFPYPDRYGQGKENVRQFLLDNPEIGNTIDAKIRDILLPKDDGIAPDDAPEEEAAVGEA